MAKNNNKNDRQGFFSQLGNYLLVLLLKVIAMLPFALIYCLSDFLYFLNNTLIRYRRKVVLENLRAAFPEKNESDILALSQRFYRHFFDFTLESVKLYGMSDKEAQKRIVFKGLAKMDEVAQRKNGALVLAFHYNNWEWCAYGQAKLQSPVLMVYNPPRYNFPMERFLLKSRGKWGGKVVRANGAARYALKYKQDKKPAILWLAADQRALARSPYWTTFLNREASFFSGPQVLAKKLESPVYFQEIKKLARGYYEVQYSVLIEQPQNLTSSEILSIYVQKMEEVIKSEPEYYLWSHKRWKHKRPATTPLI